MMREETNTTKHGNRYSPEFQKEAVEYLINSGKSQIAAAKELGICDVTLANWKRKFAGDPPLKTPDPETLKEGELLRELKRVRKENEYLKRQREILKKAMSILGEEPDPGMR